MTLNKLFASAALAGLLASSAAYAGSPAPVVVEEDPYAVVPVAAAPAPNTALLVAGGVAALALIAAYWLARFPISREQHEARVAARGARAPQPQSDPLDEAVRADPDAHTITP